MRSGAFEMAGCDTEVSRPWFLKCVAKLTEAGPVREQPHRVLAEMHASRLTAPRPAGRPVRGHPREATFATCCFRRQTSSLMTRAEPQREPSLVTCSRCQILRGVRRSREKALDGHATQHQLRGMGPPYGTKCSITLPIVTERLRCMASSRIEASESTVTCFASLTANPQFQMSTCQIHFRITLYGADGSQALAANHWQALTAPMAPCSMNAGW